MAENRQADPATQVTVDEMILDYLVYMAVKAVLQDRKAERSRTQPLPQQSRADLHLEMVDAFLLVFKANHPTYQAQLGMRFRLRLLQHTTLSMRRISAWPTTPTLPSLKEIRCQNQERASVWLSHRHSSLTSLPPTSLALQIYDTALPLPKTTLLRNRTYISQVLGAPHTPTPFYGLARCPSLLDNLPGFMAVSAAQVAMINSSTVTKRWMSLAARYMMQSALEQYLVYGERGSEKLLQAFAWGFDAYLVADEGSDEWETNAVFWDDDAEVEGWEEIRSAHLEAFVPGHGIPLEVHLEDLVLRNPIDEFEDDMIAFLEAFLGCQPRPILTQMEEADLEGLSSLQTESLRSRVGSMC